jgi:Flp pilus assembly protein TadD
MSQSQPAPTETAEPDNVSDHIRVLFNEGKYAEVVALCQKILQINLRDYAIWSNLGIALRKLNREDAALVCLKRAMELQPDSPLLVRRHYAHALRQLGRVDEALLAYTDALRLFPQDVDLNLFYAVALSKFGQNVASLAQSNVVLKLDPANAEAVSHRADVMLRLGKFSDAWKDYETRWASDSSVFSKQATQEKTYPSKRWMGEDLAGKTIMIYGEQGYGDTILCSRYIPLVKARGAARIIFGCADALHNLFRTIPHLDVLSSKYHIGEKIDYHVPVMSLPGVFGTTLETIPPPPPLNIPAGPPAAVVPLLARAQNRLKVGIVWSGSAGYSGNKERAVTFTRFLDLAGVGGVQLYSLQKGPQEQELTQAGAQELVLELGPHLNDFTDTAAVLKQLDLVIMTDSSVAHLSGSIGCPVWNLLPTRAYWIYLLGRQDSPWYPSMRLFRQPTPGDWDSVFKTVAAELEKLSHNKQRSLT